LAIETDGQTSLIELPEKDMSVIEVSNPASEIQDAIGLAKLQILDRESVRGEVAQLLDQVLGGLAYQDWVRLILGTVIVTPNVTGHSQSGSWDRAAGIVYFSRTMPRQAVEALVHEAAHQYFYLGRWFSEYTNESAGSFFSPAVKKERPLWAILLSYHAFANVTIYYRQIACQLDANDEAWYERNMELSDKFNKILEQNSGLTTQGRKLFESLRAQIEPYR